MLINIGSKENPIMENHDKVVKKFESSITTKYLYMEHMNMATIKQLKEKLESFGLIEVTTRRQKANGTISFIDERTGDHYAAYGSSGYVRRIYGHSHRMYYSLNRRQYLTGFYKLHPGDTKKLLSLLIEYLQRKGKSL